MFYIALLFLLLLAIFTAIVVVQNFGDLFSTSIQLTFLSWHLPGIPVLLLCLLGVFLGGLLLYVFAAYAARRDILEMKALRERIEDLEALPARSPSGGLSANFAPSVVPMPGFPPAGSPLGSSGSVNQLNFPSGGPVGPAGPVNQPGSGGPTNPGPAAAPGQQQPPANTLHTLSPSSSGSNLSLPPRLFPPQQSQQSQQMQGQRPPFLHP